ncbi:origin recognition complex subunit [Sporothrix brasiliensis 5110]|uniref:Origin recognition complex subunit n=1 Tax=Sporothrix brasiliensis 5110 TaxID=1398154 RepID=A0A0C2FBS2_9PEZI|nr:origin recognition complex subunit [Sporothrix brasiliensis 5110]KIH88523.1 origin recognition complex subunit [Sporothrix brasiliensis 5110]
MARTTTPRNSNRGGVAEATTVPTSSPSATRLDRRQVSPPSDTSVAEQLNTPTRKRSTTAARRTNGTASGSVYDVPGDDGRDVFENSRKTDERYLSVATAHKPNGSRSSRKRKATSAEPLVTTNLDEEIDDRGEEGIQANGHGDDGEGTDSGDGPARSLSVAAETALDSAIEAEPPVAGPTPTSKRRRTGDAFATPTKSTPTKAARGSVAQTPNTRRTLADRSARKKSTRALIDRMVAGADDDDEDEAALNDAILDADDEDGEDGEDVEDDEDPEAAAEPAAFELGQEPPAVLEAHEASLDAPTPRKRGRPPKAKGAATPAKAAPAVPGANGQPAKRGRGRPRKTDTGPSTSSAAARDATPPRDLPAHEHYFFQNRAGAGIKTSNNTLAALRLLTYDEYFRLRDGGTDNIVNRHEKQIGYLEELHSQSFAQWAFELSQGFSVCLYGYGSKQRVLRAFARALHKGIRDHDAHKIVMVNTNTAGAAATAAAAAAAPSTTGGSMGMTASAAASTLRDIMLVVAAAAGGVASTNGNDAAHTAAPKLPSGLAAAERIVMSLLDKAGKAESAFRVTLIISGIDSPSLRRPAAQATLARLAAHRSISLLCAADTPGFPLLWDGAARSQQNFVFHDATTFRPLAGLDTVDEVHALLGRRMRRVGGKDGAAFVLRSLPENARTLFQLLVGEVLAADEGQKGGGSGGAGGFGYDDEDDEYGDNDGGDHDDGAGESVALEYRMLYNKAVEEFICSSEMAFRTLLKEFHDHQMVLSRKDAFGTEMLSLPFRRDELEALLEDLAS